MVWMREPFLTHCDRSTAAASSCTATPRSGRAARPAQEPARPRHRRGHRRAVDGGGVRRHASGAAGVSHRARGRMAGLAAVSGRDAVALRILPPCTFARIAAASGSESA